MLEREEGMEKRKGRKGRKWKEYKSISLSCLLFVSKQTDKLILLCNGKAKVHNSS
jgi:hypothetical protein